MSIQKSQSMTLFENSICKYNQEYQDGFLDWREHNSLTGVLYIQKTHKQKIIRTDWNFRIHHEDSLRGSEALLAPCLCHQVCGNWLTESQKTSSSKWKNLSSQSKEGWQQKFSRGWGLILKQRTASMFELWSLVYLSETQEEEFVFGGTMDLGPTSLVLGPACAHVIAL